MNFLELISQRESIRNYDPTRPLSAETLTQILEAGRMAPSAVNYQPWKFVVVQSSEMLEKVRATYPRSWFVEAPLILIVVGDKTVSWKRSSDNYDSIETDLAIAMDHIILMAESLEVATCWVENYDNEALRTALQLAQHEVVFAMTPLGYPKADFVKKGIKKRKSLDEVVKYI